MLQSIESLPFFETLVVIINCDTKKATTLALLSALHFTNFPVLIVDSSINKDELYYFERLQGLYNFFIIALPLNVHGKTLDYLFLNLNADNILLLDSDAEILSKDLWNYRGGGGIFKIITDDNIFGYGFTHGPSPMTNKDMRGGIFCYYQERMYIPCVLLKTVPVKEALRSGHSFAAKKVYNDFPLIPLFSRLLYYRFYFNFFQRHDISILRLFRKIYNDYYKPSMIYYDTGADIYMYLKYKCGYDFIGLPQRYSNQYFAHYHGITRKILNPKDFNSKNYDTIQDEISNNLKTKYLFDFDYFCSLVI